ncbi:MULTISPECIES: hypothetical protein [unclassified Streptomyces]|uniref:hypothetical protein n=1 Tax=unclassified Streptomyces TaxID=2593676 RepID=UPI0036550551
MRFAWQDTPGQVRDAATFIGLPNPALWSGPPVREGDLAGWMDEVKYFTRLEIDSVITLHSRSGTPFELYGRGSDFLNPVRVARYVPCVIEAENAEENPKVLALARTAWREHVDAVAQRFGAPVRVAEDEDEVLEAIWRLAGDEGPDLRLWLNATQVLVPDSPLYTRLPGRALIRLDAHAPEDMAGVTPRPVDEANDVPEWIPDGYQKHAVDLARAEYEAFEDEDRVVDRVRHALGGAVAGGGSVLDLLGTLVDTPFEVRPEADSYSSRHIFRHPDAPQGRLPALHVAHVISVLANHEQEGSARTAQSVEPGLTLHHLDLFNPRVQNSLGVTGREACGVWRLTRAGFEKSIAGKAYMITPADVMERLRTAALAAGTPEEGESPSE